MRLRIKSRKVSTAPQWISKYLPAHTATAVLMETFNPLTIKNK